MLHINKQMLHHLTVAPCFRERIFCRGSPETLTDSHYWCAPLMNTDKRLQKFPPKKGKKATPSWSVFQPYVKHRRPAVAKDSSVFQMSPREQCLWNQFRASLEMAAERDCRRGWDVAARHQSSSPGRTCDLQTSRRRKPGAGGSFFFFSFFLSTCTSIIWTRMEAMLPCDPATGGSRRRTLSSPVAIDTRALTLSLGNSRRPFAVKKKKWRNDVLEEGRNGTIKGTVRPKLIFYLFFFFFAHLLLTAWRREVQST